MKKQLSYLIIFTLVLSMFVPMANVSAAEGDSTYQALINNTNLAKRFDTMNVNDIALAIKLLDTESYTQKYVKDVAEKLEKDHKEVHDFLRDNHGIHQQSMMALAQVLQEWRAEEAKLKQLLTDLKEDKSLEAARNSGSVAYIDALRDKMSKNAILSSTVLKKWNEGVLKSDKKNEKIALLMEMYLTVIDNSSVRETESGKIDLYLTASDKTKLAADISAIEEKYIAADSNKITKSSATKEKYMPAIESIVDVMEKTIEGILNKSSLIKKDMLIQILQDFGVDYVKETSGGTDSGGTSGGTTGGTTPDITDDVKIVDEDKKDDVVKEGEAKTDEPKSIQIDVKAKVDIKADTNTGAADVKFEETDFNNKIDAAVKAFDKKIEEEAKTDKTAKEKKMEVVLDMTSSVSTTKQVKLNLPSSSMKKLQENDADLVIKTGKIEIKIPAEALSQVSLNEGETIELVLDDLFAEVKDEKAKIESEKKAKDAQEKAENEKLNNNVKEQKVLKVLEFKMLRKKGEEVLENITKFNKKLKVKADVSDIDVTQYDKLGMYHMVDGKPKFVGGKIKNNKLQFVADGFSNYVAMTVDITYDDVASNWAKKEIESMAAKHVVKGYEDGNFMPAKNVTRAEFSKLVVTALEYDMSTYMGQFTDVTAKDWFAEYVQVASEKGLITGYNNMFRPNEEITRQEMAAILSRAIVQAELTKEDVANKLSVYYDANSIADWSYESIAQVVNAGLMNGTPSGKFNPQGLATRAEATTVIYRLFNK